MKCLSVALLALVCLQAAVANPVHYPVKKPVYVPAPKPSPVPSPAPKPITVTCTPKPTTTVVAANVTCGAGYTLSSDAYKKGYVCSKQVCYDPKPEYQAPVHAVKGKHYFAGKKYAPVVYKKPVYVAPSPAPKPSPKPVCKTQYAAPIYTCAAGYTLSGSHCVLSVPGPCPPTYTASAGVCTYTYVPTYAEKKPVYSTHYFFGKKFASKKEEAPAKPEYAKLAYCDDKLYPKPSPSPVVYKKPVYEGPEPKKSFGSWFKHGL